MPTRKEAGSHTEVQSSSVPVHANWIAALAGSWLHNSKNSVAGKVASLEQLVRLALQHPERATWQVNTMDSCQRPSRTVNIQPAVQQRFIRQGLNLKAGCCGAGNSRGAKRECPQDPSMPCARLLTTHQLEGAQLQQLEAGSCWCQYTRA